MDDVTGSCFSLFCLTWCAVLKCLQDYSGLLIFRGKKKQNFAGFSGANSRKNRPISREKSQNSRKNRPISRDFSGKKSNYEGFSGANSKKNRPISREISGGNFAKKQSVKNSRFRWDFFGKFG